jgi:ribosomal protein S18 acetylase RimI-like enzyme
VNRIVLDGDERDFLDWREGSGSTIEIFDVAVGSERRAGKGRRLLRMLFAAVPAGTVTVWAITRAKNTIAREWYVGCGFRVVGLLRGFYEGDARQIDAIMYARRPGDV